METFLLKIDNDAMEVKLCATNGGAHTVTDQSALREMLAAADVKYGIDTAAIEQAFAALATASEGQEFIIARGTPPQHGKNGYIEFLVNVSGKPIYDGTAIKDVDFAKLDSIDYKNAMRVVSVKAGDKIAVVHPPTAGIFGKNLAGKSIAARNGKPMYLRVGDGAAFSSDNVTVIAQADGRPVYNNKTLIVSQVFEVPGDVCFDTGNIKFDGYVTVRGNVQDDFSIEARNVEIEGVVGAAKITCRGNLIVHGGINGKNRALIMCQGTADLKYVNCAKLEVCGDVNVAREIANSTVWCRSTVRAGTIMGGEILALHGIEAKFFGSEMGTPTILGAGINYEVRRIENTARIFCQNIAQILKSIGPNFGDHKYFLSLPPERQQKIRDAYTLFVRLQDAHRKLLFTRKQLLERRDCVPVKMVVALKYLCHDVTVQTPACRRLFLKGVKGPVAFIEDVNNNTIKVAAYDAANAKAAVLVSAENKEAK